MAAGLGFVLLTMAAAGCSGAKYPQGTAQGAVTLDGAPVTKGYVTFTPATSGQGPVTGGAIAGGAYKVEKVPLGKHAVSFQLEGPPTTLRDVATGQDRQVPTPVNLAPEFAQGVSAEVAQGANKLDFNLKSAP